MTTSLFLFSSNPTLIIVWLVLVSMLVGFILSLQAGSWIFFAVVLLFTGGIMVLFRYMLTLVSSNKVAFYFSSALIVVVWGVLLIFGVSWNPLEEGFSIIRDLYAFRQSRFLIFLALYLFLVLVVVVKLALNFKGALKSFATHEL